MFTKNNKNQYMEECNKFACTKTFYYHSLEDLYYIWKLFIYKFPQVELFIAQLPSDYSYLKSYMIEPDLLPQLHSIHKHIFLTENIKKLEANDITLAFQFERITDCYNNLESQEHKIRFNEILVKNSGFDKLMTDFNDLLVQIPPWMTYLNCLNCACERTFNYLKLLLSHNRRSIDHKYLEIYMRSLVNNSNKK
ncbi:hypothetical protein M153_25600010370 [Pseudoloma neurophilia]|uniref:Uncharacterized protein n=1 Tax=Pseudoloma neurophilia TaxID=146866 RepID=A0A0R0LYV7_9MICR|nr:hypothetical protein M153_25600010370 [Pseudoloma neurophilia]